MHICFVGEGIHPPWTRGHQTVSRELISCLGAKAEVSLITTKMGQGCKYSSQSSEFTKQLKKLIEVKGSGNFYLDSFRLSKAFSKFAKENKVDVVHLTGINVGIFALWHRLSKPPDLIIIRHYYMPLPEKSVLNTLMKPLLYLIYSRLIDGITVTSPLVKEWLSKRIQPERVSLISLPVDCEFFKPLENNKFRNDEGQHTMLYLGSISRKRFPLSVLQALSILKGKGVNILLLVIGRYDSEYSENWLKKIRETISNLDLKKNIKVELKALNEEEKLSLYNSVDMVIFPYEEHIEVTDPPITLLEAMSCGRVVLASKIQSIPHLISHGTNGFLLDSLKAEEIAEKIELGLNSSWNELSSNARNIIRKHFSRGKVAGDLFNFYQGFLN